MTEHSDFLLEALRQRPADKGFEFACIKHNGPDTAYRFNVKPWSRRGLFRFITISDQ